MRTNHKRKKLNSQRMSHNPSSSFERLSFNWRWREMWNFKTLIRFPQISMQICMFLETTETTRKSFLMRCLQVGSLKYSFSWQIFDNPSSTFEDLKLQVDHELKIINLAGEDCHAYLSSNSMERINETICNYGPDQDYLDIYSFSELDPHNDLKNILNERCLKQPRKEMWNDEKLIYTKSIRVSTRSFNGNSTIGESSEHRWRSTKIEVTKKTL